MRRCSSEGAIWSQFTGSVLSNHGQHSETDRLRDRLDWMLHILTMIRSTALNVAAKRSWARQQVWESLFQEGYLCDDAWSSPSYPISAAISELLLANNPENIRRDSGAVRETRLVTDCLGRFRQFPEHYCLQIAIMSDLISTCGDIPLTCEAGKLDSACLRPDEMAFNRQLI